VTHLIEQFGYLAVFLLVGLEALGIPLPGETTLVSAALYAGATHNLQPAGVVLAAVIGATFGYTASYAIGHWGGYRLLVRYGRYVRLDQAKVKVARYLFGRYGGRVVFFGRFIPILRAYGAFLAGTSRMPWRRFALFNAIGAVAWAVLYGGGAYLLGNEIERASRRLAIVLGSAALLLIVAAVIVIRRRERELENAAEQALPGPLEGYPGGREL
jgi:membrane protein DedA with SNARE-associated domain